LNPLRRRNETGYQIDIDPLLDRYRDTQSPPCLKRQALSRCKNTTFKINGLRLPLMICRIAKYGARLGLIAENQVVTLSHHLATLKGLLKRPIAPASCRLELKRGG
jgi:hypothetical protein